MPSDSPTDEEIERLRAELNTRREALIKGLVDESVDSQRDDDRDGDDA